MEISLQNLIHPLPKQKQFFEAILKYKYILYGGAMGGGKSYALRWALVSLLLYYWQKYKIKGIRVALFCEDYPSLRDRHLSRLLWEFPEWLGIYRGSVNEYILSPSLGSGTICFRNLDEPAKYKSAEFAAIAIDELTQNDKEIFDFLRTRLRWPGIKEVKFLAGTNPGGKGHFWVKKYWIDRDFPPEEKEAHLFHFVPATAYDNPYLPQTYFDGLKGLPKQMKQAFLEGSWNLFVGQYFTEWNPEKHIISPFSIPKHWKRFRSYDHGRASPACCKWYALDEKGTVYVYKEFYQAGLNIDQIAKIILEMSGNEEYLYSVADPSIFAKLGLGETIAEEFARYGIVWEPASARRIDGWNIMHQYLYWDEKTEPKIKYFSTCENSIRTIPLLIHSKTNPEDLDTSGEDHAADCDRYLLQTLRERATPPSKPELSEDNIWYTIKKRLEEKKEGTEFDWEEVY